MFDTQVWIEGTVVGTRSGIFKDLVQQKEIPFGVVQMCGREREAVKIFEIALAEGFDMNRYLPGKKMKVPVRIGSSKDGKRIFYREVPAAEMSNAKPAGEQRPPASA